MAYGLYPLATDSLATSQPQIYNNFSYIQTVFGGSNTMSNEYRALFVGEIRMYGGTVALCPTGWLPCDGRELSTTNASCAALYAVIGTRYGSGTGTFKIPSFISRFPRGVSDNPGSGAVGSITGSTASHTLTLAEMPTHSHTYSLQCNYETSGSTPTLGAGLSSGSATGNPDTSTTGSSTGHTHALGSGDPIPAYEGVLFIIKF